MAITLVIGPASPAWAHSVGGTSGSSNYRTSLLGVNPPLPGVVVKVLDDGSHIQLANTSTATVVILGYSGEPYLMVDATGVWQNTRSPSLYLNRSSTPGLVYMPPGTDAHAPPSWQRICTCHVALWHDHRIHWGAPQAPAAVSASPGRYHLIETWHINAMRGSQNITISGLLSWVPGPSPAPWLGAAGAIALAALAVGFVRRWRIPLAVALLLLVALDIGRTTGLALGHSGSLSTQLHSLPYDGAFSLTLWLASLVVARFALRGRVGAAYATATISVILALTGAVTTLSALWHSQLISAYPANLQRLLTTATLGVGTGLFAASFILIDRLDKLQVSRQRGQQIEAQPAEINQ